MSDDVEVTLTESDNTVVWYLIGRNQQFPDLMHCDHTPPVPGQLVSSYNGQRYLEKKGRMGLGMIIGVIKHPHPLGSCQWWCYVLWNFRPLPTPP